MCTIAVNNRKFVQSVLTDFRDVHFRQFQTLGNFLIVATDHVSESSLYGNEFQCRLVMKNIFAVEEKKRQVATPLPPSVSAPEVKRVSLCLSSKAIWQNTFCAVLFYVACNTGWWRQVIADDHAVKQYSIGRS